ncbi:DUF3179 domain-containing protein [Winogradskyella immobilis]|uniref:DUF3179 domain-containing protein n=1 Tax=Winogradskyella immobilis TaxID=2816852 RepID=A0ABS8EQG6_9FLAO|nr:DUF3179 domain-containing protein [Winogradskyella immobilis]MCC1485077.1 DUF3179 domain-containing protein [Winogradskyella immobilis]MCG0017169.1 DUF3179 domain-containing protein [Winogradskyella immobilis]
MKYSISRIKLVCFIIITFWTVMLFSQQSDNSGKNEVIEYANFLKVMTSDNESESLKAIKYIESNWKPEFEIMVLELLYFSRSTKSDFKLLDLLHKKTGKNYGLDFNRWYEWIWSKDEKLAPYYHKFKAQIHSRIDRHFPRYFSDRQDKRTIRLDEIRWGGVRQDGIPPLRNPTMISAKDADYLDDDNVVFGIEVNGDFRAYPKRILAWHEMFTDTVGGIPVAGVYCTLCGTVILYKTELNGTQYQLGTSGFLYRSNKLMYDKKTQSLWNTIWGKPVVGPLVGKDIQLEYLSVVTTTWGEWKARHPETTVLDLNTGFSRDYGEGVAYKNYFSTDDLMFNVPSPDRSVKYKQSILAIRLPEISDNSIAISTKYLKKHPIYKSEIEGRKFVVLTDKSGANRVFFTENIDIVDYDGSTIATDNNGVKWNIHENHLENSKGKILKRLHSFNAFWFGWKAAYPNTILIK